MIYWRLQSIPELHGLSKEDALAIHKEACKRLRAELPRSAWRWGRPGGIGFVIGAAIGAVIAWSRYAFPELPGEVYFGVGAAIGGAVGGGFAGKRVQQSLREYYAEIRQRRSLPQSDDALYDSARP